MKKMMLIIIVILLFLCSGCNKNADTDEVGYKEKYLNLLEAYEVLNAELNSLKEQNEKLEVSLESQEDAFGTEFADNNEFLAVLEETNQSLESLIEFYYQDLYPRVQVGSAYGETYGIEVINFYFSMDINDFLLEVRKLPAGCVDGFSANMVTAVELKYQYEEITEEEYRTFVDRFTELSMSENTEDEDKQFVYEIMAHLYEF